MSPEMSMRPAPTPHHHRGRADHRDMLCVECGDEMTVRVVEDAWGVVTATHESPAFTVGVRRLRDRDQFEVLVARNDHDAPPTAVAVIPRDVWLAICGVNW